jgi:LuxR family maltose regulon positive regulatory protein
MAGDLAAVAAVGERAREALPLDNPMARGLLVCLAPLLASAQRERGRPEEIDRFVHDVMDRATGAPAPALYELSRAIVDAEASWAVGRLDDAEAALRYASTRWEALHPTHHPDGRAELAVLLAERGRRSEAAEVLGELVDVVAPTGAWGRIAQSGRGLLAVLDALDGTRREAASVIRALLEISPSPGARPVPGTPEALTSRECEVLAEMAAGASNRDIAARLYVSENTVKTHVKRVIAKLGARSRTEAVARARELGLL